MEITSKSKDLLIDSGVLNHMMAERYSFLSLEIDKSILEHGYFSNVLYVPSLASNLLSVYQMKHTGVPKRVSFILDDVEIT